MDNGTITHEVIEYLLGYSPIVFWAMSMLIVALLFTVNRLWVR